MMECNSDIDTAPLSKVAKLDNALLGAGGDAAKSEIGTSATDLTNSTSAENEVESSTAGSVLVTENEKNSEVAESKIEEMLKDCQNPSEVEEIDTVGASKNSPDLPPEANTNEKDFISAENAVGDEHAADNEFSEGIEVAEDSTYFSQYGEHFCSTPLLRAECHEFKKANYTRGCLWSPDGTCLLSNSNDNVLRLFNIPQELYESENCLNLESVLKVKEGGTIYDFCWYPLMNSQDPSSCSFVCVSKSSPIHMWDAYDGKLKCSYQPFNNVDEITSPHGMCFSTDGRKLYCGFKKTIRVFDTDRPGRDCATRPTYVKQGQHGILSCLAVNPIDPGMYAAGSFSKSVAVYTEPAGEIAFILQGQSGGITQLKFSSDGTKLLCGARKDHEILCWDMRNPGSLLFVMKRIVHTNQRMYMDIADSTLVSGNHNGTVTSWDLQLGSPCGADDMLPEQMSFLAHNDCVNGVSLHPTIPLLATSSGQRHFPSQWSDGEDDEAPIMCSENSIKLWWTGKSLYQLT